MGRLRAFFNRVLPAGPGRTHVLVALGLVFSLQQFGMANSATFSFDDYKLIVENPTIRSFDSVGAVLASGRPMRGLTFMLDYALFGLDARGYHRVNVAWHYLVCLLLYFLVFRLFGTRIAVLTAFLFAFHPIHAEAVIGIAHRKEMLAATFLLLAFHAFLYRRRWPRVALGGSLIFFALGLLSKQVVAILPVLLLCWEWLRREPEERVDLWRLWPWLVLPAGLLIGGALVSLPVLADFNFFGHLSIRELTFETWSRALATTLNQAPRFLRGLLFPVHLTALPPVETRTFADFGPWFGATLLLAVAAAAVAVRRDRAVSFGLFWVFINLLPVMNWVPVNSIYADRYLYIPSVGFCLAVAGTWARLEKHRGELLGPRAASAMGYALLVGILIMPSGYRYLFNLDSYWTFPELWRMDPATGVVLASLLVAMVIAFAITAMNRPRFAQRLDRRPALEFALLLALLTLLLSGTMLVAEGLIERRLGFPDFLTEAKFAYIRQFVVTHVRHDALSVNPAALPRSTDFKELVNIFIFSVVVTALLMLVVLRLERKPGANRLLLVRTQTLIFISLYAASVLRIADWSSEIRLWRTAIMEDSNSIYGYNNLGKAYLDRRRLDLAIFNFRRAADLGPDLPEPWVNLGMAYLGTRQLDLASKSLERAIKLRPSDLGSRLNLANILVVQAESGKLPDGYRLAVTHYMYILQANPGSAHALNNLAYCYYKLGAYEQALDYAERSIQLDPVSPKPRDLRATIEATMRAERDQQAKSEGEIKP